MTRKIVFGMLMTLVLAFSVQGTVDAQSVSVSGDGATTSTSSGTTVIRAVPSALPIERSFTVSVSSVKNGETVNIAGVDAAVTAVEVTSAPSPQTKFDTDADTATPDVDSPGGLDTQITPAKGSLGTNVRIGFSGLGKPDSPDGTGTSGSWTPQGDLYGGYLWSIQSNSDQRAGC